MAKNVIYYFTGTGNSLKAAKDVAAALEDCDLIPIAGFASLIVPEGYERVGFAFPVYAAGLPNLVRRFLTETDFAACRNAYFFAVATCGAMGGTALYDVRRILRHKSISLDAGFGVRMFSNYVVLYDMASGGEHTHARSQRVLGDVAQRVARKERTRRPLPNPLFSLIHTRTAKGFAAKDEGFSVSGSCAGCGQCAALCPVGNIVMLGGRPGFHHRCEQCMACIQLCPRRAINYQNKTQKRGRYCNPSVSLEELKNKQT